MKIKIWVVSTCVPNETEPCLPSVHATEAEAEAYADKMLRAEWEANGPEDPDTGERKPYPGNWREAQTGIVEFTGALRTFGKVGDETDDAWGQWEITSHQIEIDASPLTLPAATLKNIRDLVDEAIYQHIFDADRGEQPGPDDPYVQAVAELDEFIAGAGMRSSDDYLARFPEAARPYADRAYQDGFVDAANSHQGGRLAVIVDGGMVQQVVADGALVGVPVTIIDYDTDGANDLTEIDQGDGTTSAAVVENFAAEKAIIVIPGGAK